VRVHDFHRSAVRLKPGAMTLRGPIKLKTGGQSNSTVGISMDPSTGLVKETRIRNASVAYDRPLQTQGISVFDHVAQEYVELPKAIAEYLEDLKPFLHAHFPSTCWA
jgi:hypothetical protein